MAKARAPGAVVHHKLVSKIDTMRMPDLRRMVRLHRARIASLVELYDVGVAERKRLRAEVRALKQEVQRLKRIAHAATERSS